MTIYHAVIHTMTEAGTIPHGFLTVENGKITCVQSGDPDTVTEDDLDAKGSLLLPGFIDAHTHLGILEDGLDFEGDDCNECTDPFTPHLRAIDGVNPLDRCFSEALAAGVTTVMTTPGSANPCGGTMLILKTAGNCVDDMKLTFGGIKFALGENPKSVYHAEMKCRLLEWQPLPLSERGCIKQNAIWNSGRQSKKLKISRIMMQSVKPCCHCCGENTRHISIAIVQMI